MRSPAERPARTRDRPARARDPPARTRDRPARTRDRPARTKRRRTEPERKSVRAARLPGGPPRRGDAEVAVSPPDAAPAREGPPLPPGVETRVSRFPGGSGAAERSLPTCAGPPPPPPRPRSGRWAVTRRALSGSSEGLRGRGSRDGSVRVSPAGPARRVRVAPRESRPGPQRLPPAGLGLRRPRAPTPGR
ncbi:basic proline-rich protein-like [Mustela lutreola]|uniref:basic proline-rich protein-like n=1 Tax=Mustela lutreola TaxID=9666 RepID=UPI00279725E5|nr:basic proline-rich protein-like [Mustela lutreola]